MKETKITCSVCGAEFAIANHEHTVENATVIGKDSGLGTIHPALAGLPNKADDRLAALKAAGVDTTNLFAMNSASGDGMIVRLEKGVPVMVADDDPIYQKLVQVGTIPDRRLFRRWVMSQMFHMLAYDNYYNGEKGFTPALKRKGYEYSWDMTVEEFRVQARLAKNDAENYILRNRWFNKDIAIAMAEDYITLFEQYLQSLKEKHCKGVPYKTIHGVNVFVDDFDRKLIAPLRHGVWNIKWAKTPQELYNAVASFDRLRTPLKWETRQCPAWVNAYKGSGAYFTLKNLILFHNCKLKNGAAFFSQAVSLTKLEEYATIYSKNNEGWRMLAFLKKFIGDNRIDINAKMKEWRAEAVRKYNNR